MSYRRCAAKTCFNTQGCRPNLKFFNFPRDQEICYLWVVNSGRTDLLNKPIEQINKFMLCADHFEPHWFLNPKYKTKFIRSGHPVPTIFYNNLVDFVPKSLQKTVVQKNISTSGERSEFYNHINGFENSVQNSIHSAADILEMLRDGDVSSESHVQLEDNTVEIKIDVDSYVDDVSTIRDCHKMCRLCACLVYEYKLISIFTADKIQNLESKINRFLPGKVLEGDGLPEHVCNSCVNKLNECDLVVQEFIAADRKLRNLFQLQNVVPTISESGTCKVHMKSPAGTTESSVFPPGLEEFLAVKDDMILNEIHQSQGNNKVHPFKESLSQEENFELAEIEHGDSQEECDALSQVEASEMEMLQDVRLEVSDDVGEISAYANSAQDLKVTKPYRCSICKAEYDERNKLLIHEITEHVFERKEMPMFHKKYKREQVACTICNEVFSGKKPLRRHIKEQHIPAENICEFCGAHYQIKSQLEVHRRLHTNEKPFLCETCNCSFHFKKELQRHNRANHSQVKSLTCAVCNKTCSTRNALWRHEKTHTDERNVLCYLCGKVLSNPQSLRVHLRTHSSDRPCSCPTCGKSFKDNTSVSKHMLMHSATKNFACDICGRAFYSKALVKQHKLSHSGIKPYKCEICGAAYNRLGNLNQHKKKHAANPMPVEDLSYECVVCGKRMRSELTLKYHLGRHTGEKKPFDCEVCGKCFVAVDPYRVHMRIHTGERPYQCTTCGKTFRSVFTLKQHSALHRDEFPYGCPYCERKFKRLQSLIVHKRTHTGEKPHICQQCGRGFAQKGDMLKHSKTHARDRHAAVSKLKEEKVVMEISELVFSDSEITNEFLIDMPIVEVETEIKTEINSGIV